MGYADETRTLNFSNITQFANEDRPMIVLGSYHNPATGQRTVDAAEKARIQDALDTLLGAFKGTGADMTFGPDNKGAISLFWDFDDEDGLLAAQQLMT